MHTCVSTHVHTSKIHAGQMDISKNHKSRRDPSSPLIGQKEPGTSFTPLLATIPWNPKHPLIPLSASKDLVPTVSHCSTHLWSNHTKRNLALSISCFKPYVLLPFLVEGPGSLLHCGSLCWPHWRQVCITLSGLSSLVTVGGQSQGLASEKLAKSS